MGVRSRSKPVERAHSKAEPCIRGEALDPELRRILKAEKLRRNYLARLLWALFAVKHMRFMYLRWLYFPELERIIENIEFLHCHSPYVHPT